MSQAWHEISKDKQLELMQLFKEVRSEAGNPEWLKAPTIEHYTQISVLDGKEGESRLSISSQAPINQSELA